MKHLLISLLFVFLVLTAQFRSTEAAIPSSTLSKELPDTVEKILPGVVNISSNTIVNYTVYGMDQFLRYWGIPKERKETSLGSGLILDKEGYIFTNYHVISKADEVIVTLSDKRKFNAKIIGKDSKLDLALLKIVTPNRKTPKNLTPVQTDNSDEVRIGEPALAVGNPFGLQHTVTMGIISAKNRTIGIGPFDNFLQTDASINPGNSGGPLFNLKGKVIGINTVIYSKTGQSGGLGFAIPINSALKALPHLKRYGRVPRPWVGVLGQLMTPQIKNHYRFFSDKGFLVFNLISRSPADRAGIKRGDIITHIGNNKIIKQYDFERYMAVYKPNQEAEMTVVRKNKVYKVTVTLKDFPPEVEERFQGSQ